MEIILFLSVIVLLFWLASLSNRVGELERRLKQGVLSKPVDSQKAVPAVDYAKLEKERPPVNQIFQGQSSSASEMAAPKPPMPISRPAPMTEAQQTEIATNWLNKIGMVAVLLGMVFFFKYAIDQGWVSPWMRVIVGLLVSGLLVYLGELWKDKYGKRAQALSGGGIALFYFTIFAAYQFYGIWSQPAAWAVMLAVAALSVWLSFRYSSLVLGILGFFGAYGSPLMLSSGQNQQVSLFVYLSIMNVVALLICLKKFWTELLFLALLGTVIDFAVWGYNYSNYENTFPSVFFVIFTSLLLGLGGAILLRHHKEKKSLPEFLQQNLSAVYIFLGSFYFVGIWALLVNRYHDVLSGIALLGSVIFFLIYALVDRLEYRAINYTLSLIGSLLFVSAAMWQYSGKAEALALLAIAVLGATLGFLLKREELRVWSLIILFISLFESLYEPYGVGDKAFLFNAKFGLMLANTLAMLFIGWLYSKFEAGKFEGNVEKGLQIVASLILWLAVSWDISTAFQFYGRHSVQNYMAFWWIVYPAALAVAAFVGKRAGLMKVALVLLLASLMKVLFLSYGPNPQLIFNAKFALMLAQTAALLFVGFLVSKSEEKTQNADVLYVIGSLFLWFAVSWEIVEYFKEYYSSNARNLALSLWWIVYAVILIIASGVTKRFIFRKVSIVLFGLAIVKVFLYDVQALDTPYRVVAFIVLGVILLSVSFSYRKNKDVIVNFIEGDKENKIIS